MNAEGFSVDISELELLASKAGELSESVRTSWQQDWFEDDKWPDTDSLRVAVIAYRRSLRAAMERLSTGTDRLAGHLRGTADLYQSSDVHAARAFDRIARAE